MIEIISGMSQRRVDRQWYVTTHGSSVASHNMMDQLVELSVANHNAWISSGTSQRQVLVLFWADTAAARVNPHMHRDVDGAHSCLPA